MFKKELSDFIKSSSSFCAVYLIGKNGPVDLTLKEVIIINSKYYYTNKTISDKDFFHDLYKKYKLGKNDILKYIEKNIKIKEEYQVDENVKLVITIPSIYW